MRRDCQCQWRIRRDRLPQGSGGGRCGCCVARAPAAPPSKPPPPPSRPADTGAEPQEIPSSLSILAAGLLCSCSGAASLSECRGLGCQSRGTQSAAEPEGPPGLRRAARLGALGGGPGGPPPANQVNIFHYFLSFKKNNENKNLINKIRRRRMLFVIVSSFKLFSLLFQFHKFFNF
jgi:hypothetical protein